MIKKDALSDDDLEQVAGGAGDKDWIHDLNNFGQHIVCNVIKYDDSACLTLRRTPNGSIIPGVGWQNGEVIYTHNFYDDQGWPFAYDFKTGKYGYVNPHNVY